MSQKRRDLLALIESTRPLSIYDLAKRTGRNYRRVHDHVHQLAETGHVVLRREVHRGRRVVRVVSLYEQRLAHLDEMFALWRSVR